MADGGRNTIIVNLYAGPGAGKTTCAWIIAGELKKLGLPTEYVPEYAKELVWDGKVDLLDGSFANQSALLHEQDRRIRRLVGKVDVVVTDSPILLSCIYARERSAYFAAVARELYNGYQNFDLFVVRGVAYEMEGRIHTWEQSLAIDGRVESLLRENGISYGICGHDTLGLVVNNILAALGKPTEGDTHYGRGGGRGVYSPAKKTIGDYMTLIAAERRASGNTSQSYGGEADDHNFGIGTPTAAFCGGKGV